MNIKVYEAAKRLEASAKKAREQAEKMLKMMEDKEGK